MQRMIGLSLILIVAVLSFVFWPREDGSLVDPQFSEDVELTELELPRAQQSASSLENDSVASVSSDSSQESQASGQELVSDRDLPEGVGSILSAEPPGHGGVLAGEARDPDWAPQTEVLIESVVRSIGGPIVDVKEVSCRTTNCQVAATYHASLIFSDQASRTATLRRLEGQIQAAMESVYRQSPRLGTVEVWPMVRLNSEVETTLENVEGNLGTIITITAPQSLDDE